eukprot:764713-Hanusia_phi.AAC.1
MLHSKPKDAKFLKEKPLYDYGLSGGPTEYFVHVSGRSLLPRNIACSVLLFRAKISSPLLTLLSTAKWRPSAGEWLLGLCTPRFADKTNRAGDDRVDLSPLFMCPLPSAVCLKKAQVPPAPAPAPAPTRPC